MRKTFPIFKHLFLQFAFHSVQFSSLFLNPRLQAIRLFNQSFRHECCFRRSCDILLCTRANLVRRGLGLGKILVIPLRGWRPVIAHDRKGGELCRRRIHRRAGPATGNGLLEDLESAADRRELIIHFIGHHSHPRDHSRSCPLLQLVQLLDSLPLLRLQRRCCHEQISDSSPQPLLSIKSFRAPILSIIHCRGIQEMTCWPGRTLPNGVACRRPRGRVHRHPAVP